MMEVEQMDHVPFREHVPQPVVEKKSEPISTDGDGGMREIEEVFFQILSPQAIEAMSFAEIRSSDIFTRTGERKEGGLFDPRLGPVQPKERCVTCSGTMSDCPGHFGHFQFARAVYHPFYMDAVLKVLRVTCFNCGEFLGKKESAAVVRAQKVTGVKRLNELSKAVSVPKEGCPHCARQQPIVTSVTSAAMLYEHAKEDAAEDMFDDGPTAYKTTLQPVEARERLRRISSETRTLLGFSDKLRPEWMVLTHMPVPPAAVRPTLMNGEGTMQLDDLSNLLRAVLRQNLIVTALVNAGAPDAALRAESEKLQMHVARYFDNDSGRLGGAPAMHAGRTLRGLRQRLNGKEGRIRGNLMGKRVNFSARSVITPDACLELDQLGVPKSIAMSVSRTENVTARNIDDLQRRVNNGPDDLFGAVCIQRRDGTRVDLRQQVRAADLTLRVGDKVERHMRDGDWVIFNRQPSLHKMSMMGHRVKVMDYSTFRLNLSVTTPYNADFDGDEMNLHFPQTDLATAEVQEIMAVPTQIVAAAKNQPVMALVQDSLLAAYKITSRDTFIERDLMYNLVMWMDGDGHGLERLAKTPPAIVKPRKMWTGKQLMSMLLPPLNLRREISLAKGEDKFFSESDGYVHIERGELLLGRLCKRTLGTSRGSIIHIIWQDHGPDVAKRFLSEAQFVLNYWMLQHGHTVGISDCLPTPEAVAQVEEVARAALEEASEMEVEARTGRLKPRPAQSYAETFEGNMNQILSKGFDKAKESISGMLTEKNNIFTIVTAGSKGTHLNIAQISAMLGQQNLMGRRMPHGFRGRSLPHFCKSDRGARAGGFVRNCFIGGLAPDEMFFHAVGGREGLVDTAVKTAETGYIQRRLVKAMEDLKVEYDGTVRNVSGSIQQFFYGEDGIDGQRREFQRVELLLFSDAEMQQKFCVRGKKAALKLPLSRPVAEDLAHSPDDLAMLQKEKKELEVLRNALRSDLLQQNRILKDEAFRPLPVNIQRLIETAQQTFKCGPRPGFRSDLNPARATQKLREACVRMRDLGRLSGGTMMWFIALLRGALSGLRAPCEHMLSLDAFTWLVAEIEKRFGEALVHPGEMVGVLASQSVGEPLTQMTLNTFHFAGVGAKNVTLGVPRFLELIGVSRNPKTPMMRLMPNTDIASDPQAVFKVCQRIPEAKFKDVIERIEVIYDPDPTESIVESDRGFLETFFWTDDIDMDRVSPFVLRLQFSTKEMLRHALTVEDVLAALRREIDMMEQKTVAGKTQSWLYTPHIQGVGEPSVVRLQEVFGDEEEYGPSESMALLRYLMERVQNLHLKGVRGITKVHMEEINRLNEIAEDGSVCQAQPSLCIITEGSNLAEMYAIDGIQHDKTRTNHFVEVLETLGIEAARAVLLEELRAVVSFDGGYVDMRHMLMLADYMTHTGRLTPINRHGMLHTDAGPLIRCTFEQSTSVLSDAAINMEREVVNGVSNSLIIGKKIPGGTNLFSLILDHEAVLEAEPPEVVEQRNAFNDVKQLANTVCKPKDPVAIIGSPIPAYAMFSPTTSPASSPRAAARVSMFGRFAYNRSSPMASPMALSSPFAPYSPTSPLSEHRGTEYSPSSSPVPTSFRYDATSPQMNMGQKRSGFAYSATSPTAMPTSPMYNPASAGSGESSGFAPYSPTSPQMERPSGLASPTSPLDRRAQYSPTSPFVNPTSPSAGFSYRSTSQNATAALGAALGENRPGNEAYSPTRASGGQGTLDRPYSPTSPHFVCPTSPQMPTAVRGGTRLYSPTSPEAYSPTRAEPAGITFGQRDVKSSLYSPTMMERDVDE